ncbi:MAG: hypothetical protein H7256_14730 [Bdellovibrio sp.]|nr:hypothetical protein [Bdellovibrio sp.]
MHDDQNQNETPSGLKALRSVPLQPSAFLATRVQRNFESSATRPKLDQKKNKASFLVGTGLMALALVVVGFWQLNAFIPPTKSNEPVFALGKPYLIRMDIREISHAEIAYAEISLGGDNIQFSSEKFKHIQRDKTIRIAAKSFSQKQYLPVVVEGVENGKAQVTVRFYNDRHELVTTRQMDLNFMGPKT